jgi:hypothetical protein
MRSLAIIIPLIFTIGCSNSKSPNIQDKDTQYQRFLHHKADKELEKELEDYDKK